ncbi:MAG: 16S rRNA (adenine(1518)-N(6)/adenine(1519)-N(6))-dimethyltransferase RsmA [Patescibacteria group bacterium]|nr:16S rRNA (adenine(1518)-N(6)/adenine(1519)-N(6))-dimethyltransferase RsmA [Patescibacteria group bacterium]
MDLLEQTKELCRLYNIKPARSKGQNFLIEEKIYGKIVAAAGLKPNDTVLEVGPGLGFLTAKLAKEAGRVVAVELDDKLAEVLKIGLMAKEIKNVEVINSDILKSSLALFAKGDFKIVANLPYNITSIFLRKFLEGENKPELSVLMLQKEVAERICAKPGGMSLLAVSVQFYAKPEIAQAVPKENFWPEPQVDSAIVKIKVKKEMPKADNQNFFQLVKFGFSAKRKMLKNNLAAGFKIDQNEAAAKIRQAGFNEKIRAQELSVDDWLKLSAYFY